MEPADSGPDAVVKLAVLGLEGSGKREAIRMFIATVAPSAPERDSWSPFVTRISIAQQDVEVHLVEMLHSNAEDIAAESDIVLLICSLASEEELQQTEEQLLPRIPPKTLVGMITTYCREFGSSDAERARELAKKAGAFCCIESDICTGQNVKLAFDTALKTALFQKKSGRNARRKTDGADAKQAAKQAAKDAAKLAVKEAAKNAKSPFAVALLTGHQTQAKHMLEATGGHANLAQCNLTELPGPLFALIPMIKELDLQNNKLDRIPVELRAVKRVLLAGNPLSAVPAVFRDAKWPKFRKYLESVAIRASNWKVRKLMLVGEEGVGKSTLARVLSQKGHKTDCNVNLSTDGVAISTVALKSGKADEIHLNVWDFGGQVIFYSTHQFFLSPKAIYILAFDLSNPQLDRVEYWMWQIKLIEEQERKPQIVLVGTHSDQCTAEEINARLSVIKRKFPRQAFPSFTGTVIPVSCQSGKGVKQLKETIVSLSDDLNALVATSWVQLHSLALEKASAGVRYCRWPQLEAWADQCGVPSSQLELAVTLLCDSGALLHFPGVQGLEEIVVLDPQWLANLMACIVTTKPNFVRSGLLLEKDLQHIFDPLLYPQDTHDALLALLSKFRLVHRIPAREAVLVPPLLPATRPAAQVSHLFPQKPPETVETFGRIYEFGKLPLGLSGRLAVAILCITELTGTLYWRDGALLEGPHEMRILVQYDPVVYRLTLLVRHEKGSVEVRERALEVWRVIVQTVQSLVKSFYPRLAANLKEKVPCIHCLRKGVYNEKVFTFAYEDVSAALREKRPFLYCHEILSPHRAVLVSKMAPDISLEDLPQIQDSSIEIQERVGGGASGEIYRGLLETADGDKVEVAVKELVVDETRHSHKKKFLDFQSEAYAMCKLSHPNVVQLHGVMVHPPRLVLPFFRGGDLFQYLHGNQTMIRETSRDSLCELSARNSLGDSLQDGTSEKEAHNGEQLQSSGEVTVVPEESKCEELNVVEERPWAERLSIAFDIASGLHYLQSITPPVIHRDLRSPNIFLTEDRTAVIGDFGLALVMRDDEVGGLLKTWQWLAPETIDSTGQVRYDLRSDLYSLGVVLWELASQRLPFEEYANDRRYATANNFKLIDIKRAIVSEGLRPSIPSECPVQFSTLIEGLWQGKPERRLSTEFVVRSLATMLGRTLPPVLSLDSSSFTRIIPRVCAADETTDGDLEHSLSSDRQGRSVSLGGVPRDTDIKIEKSGTMQQMQTPVFSLTLQLHDERLVSMINAGEDVWMGWSGGSVLVVEQRKDGSADVLQHMTLHGHSVNALVPVSDTTQVWSCSADGAIIVWEHSSFQRISQWLPHKEKSSVLSSLLYVSMRAPPAASAHPLSTRRDFIMAGSAPPPVTSISRKEVWCAEALQGKISIWDAKSRRLLQTITDDALSGMAQIARMGRLVWAATPSGRVALFDAATYDAVGMFVAHKSSVTALACSGSLMWTVADSQIRVWRAEDVVDLECIAVQELHAERITALVSLCDGRLVASASLDGSIFLWDGKTGDFVRILAEELEPIECLAAVGPFLWCVDAQRNLTIWRVGEDGEGWNRGSERGRENEADGSFPSSELDKRSSWRGLAMADEEATPTTRWRASAHPSVTEKKSKRRRASAGLASLLRGSIVDTSLRSDNSSKAANSSKTSNSSKAETSGKRVLGTHRDT